MGECSQSDFVTCFLFFFFKINVHNQHSLTLTIKFWSFKPSRIVGCSELTIRLLNTKLIFRLIVYFVALMKTHIMPTGTATKLGVFGASNHGVRTQFGWKTRVVLVGLNLIYLQFLWSKSCSWSIHVTYKKIYMVLEIRSKGLNLNHSWLKGFYHTLPGSLLSPTNSSGLGFCLISVFTNSPSHLRKFYRRLISCFVQMLF